MVRFTASTCSMTILVVFLMVFVTAIFALPTPTAPPPPCMGPNTPIQTNQYTKPRMMSLDFHHANEVAEVIDFEALSGEELSQQQLYIIQTSPHHLAQWGNALRPILVDFIPENHWLVYSSGEEVQKIIQNVEGILNQKDLEAVTILPPQIRLSRPVQEFLELRDRDSSPLGLQLQFERILERERLERLSWKNDNDDSTPVKVLKDDNYKKELLSTHDTAQIHRKFAMKHNITQNNDVLLSIQTPQCWVNDQKMFQEAVATTNKHRQTVLADCHQDNASNAKISQDNMSLMRNVVSAVPVILDQFEEFYHLIESDIDNGFIFNDPNALRAAVDIDTYTTDQTMAQIGSMTTSASQSFIATFIDLDPNIKGLNEDGYTYNDLWTRHAEGLLGKLNDAIEGAQLMFKTTLSTPSSLSQPINTNELSRKTVFDVFTSNKVDLSMFVEKFDAIYTRLTQHTASSETTKSPKSSKSTQSTPTTHLLPLHVSLQHTTRPTNTISTSNVSMNDVRIQFQSPLLLTNTTFITETIYSRLHSFSVFIEELGDNGVDFDGIMDQVQDVIAEMYFSSVFTHERNYFCSTPQDEELRKNFYNNYQPAYNVRANVIQYVDAVIMAIYQTQFEQRIDKSVSFTSNSMLSIENMAEMILNLIQHQSNTIHQQISTSIHEILSKKNVYSVELDQKTSLFNNYARFALTVGLDNIPVNYDVPLGMSSSGPYNDAGVNGSGVIISVADSGADSGSCYLLDGDKTHPVPFTKISTSETISTHRKFKSYLTLGDKLDYLNGHGSHVTGSVVGSCATQGAVSKAVQNGALPNGLVSFVDFAIGNSMVSFDFSTIFQHAVANGAIITSNSWGNAASKINHVAQNNLYSTKESRAIDQFLNTNQGLAALFATSNDGLVAFGTINQQIASKNIIAIGSTQASKGQGAHAKQANTLLPAFQSTPTSFSNLHNLYGGTSSMGPTFDGRIKPDFVAPGASVTSIAATADSSYSCGWTIKSGTSMATPTSAGLWGMMQQILMEGRVNSGTPRSSRAYDKSTITGTFLRALAMQSAQRIDYRSNYIDAQPQPMKMQTTQLQPISSGGVTYNHFTMGDISQNQFSQGQKVSFYVQPTRNNPFVTSTKRLIRFIPYFGCKNAAFTASMRVGDDTGPQEAPYTKSFVFESADLSTRTTLDVPLLSSKSLYITLEFTAAPCSASGNTLTMFFQEFIGETYATAQRYQDATCNDRFDDLPTYILPNFLSSHRHYIRCPPTPACADLYDSSNVYGNRHYSTNSSICRAALHTGAVNMTLYDLADQNEAQKHILNGHRQTVMVTESTTALLRKEVKSKFYGVTSQYLDTSAIDPSTKDYVDVDVFGFEVVGEPLEGDGDKHNDLMYLRKLPPTQNFASGYGLPKLSSIFPLTQHIFYQQAGQSSSNTVQRYSAVLKIGVPNHAINDGQAQSHCVFVSSKPLANVYKVPSESEIWTSGEDSFRTSLTWYDVPSSATSTNTRVLINDLDLFVFGPDGSEHRGNQRADRLNNGERVDLLQGTFTPGMYCSVVNAVNVPVGPQRYSLVSHGRGLEYCLENPWLTQSVVFSGTFQRGNVQCSGVNSFNDDNNDNNFDPYQTEFLDQDPEMSQFHKEVDNIQVRGGGDCFSIHDITFPSAVSKANVFKQQRLSSAKYENEKNWDLDSKSAFATTSSQSRFVMSGRLAQGLTFSGEFYNFAVDPTYDLKKPIEEQIVEIPGGNSNINELMMEKNIKFLVTGNMDISGKSFQLTLKGSSKQCQYTFHRTQQYEDVQFY